jgi:hypothetical protein
LWGGNYVEDREEDGRIASTWIVGIGSEEGEWMELAQNHVSDGCAIGRVLLRKSSCWFVVVSAAAASVVVVVNGSFSVESACYK